MTGAEEIELLKQLVAIPSLSGTEHRITEFIARLMTDIGLRCDIDKVGNVIVRAGAADGPEIMLLGHVDTVAPVLPVAETETGILYGRGTVDAKGAMAVFLSVASRCRNLPVRIVVIGAVEEETSSLGARSLREWPQPDILLIGEPSGVDSVVIGYKGQLKGTLTAVEPPAHSAGNSLNAAQRLMGIWSEIETLCASLSAAEGEFRRITPSIRRMDGEQSLARLEFEIRLPPGLDSAAFIEALYGISGNNSLRIFDYVPAVQHDRSSLLCRSVITAIRRAGMKPKVKVKTGTSDMNTVAPFWASAAIAYGPGDSALDHRSDEHINLSEYCTAIDVLEQAIRAICEELRDRDGRKDAEMPAQLETL